MRIQNETVSHAADEMSLAAFIVGDELEACVSADLFEAVLGVALGTIAGAVTRARKCRGPEGFELSLREYARTAARAGSFGHVVPRVCA